MVFFLLTELVGFSGRDTLSLVLLAERMVGQQLVTVHGVVSDDVHGLIQADKLALLERVLHDVVCSLGILG